jgi:superfamily II DNA or RNA helicase
MAQLRPYQEQAVAGIFEKLAAHRSTLLVLPTGTGKTVVFSEVARRWTERNGKVLVLAHREELIYQAREKLEAAGLSPGIEMGDQRSGGLLVPRVVVATVQTMGRESRRRDYRPDTFSLIIVDEAHRILGDQYRAVIDYFPGAKVLAVTATPDRADGAGLGAVCESVAHVYEIRDAIKEGFLVPIRQKAVQVEGLDLSRVRTTAGDLNEGDLEQILVEEEALHGVAHPTIELAGDRPTMVFAATVAHAHALAAVMNRRLDSMGRRHQAVALDGTVDREVRRATLRRFAAGEFQFLLNCALFLEGFDSPRISCVAMARPTKSRALYTQAIGRGTRLHPGKSDLLVLDFEGNAGRHSLVCALDVLDGTNDDEVRKKARALIDENEQLDIMEAIDLAASAVAESKRKKVIAEAKYKAVDVDPFSVLGVHAAPGRWGGQEMTDRQREVLERAGIDAKQLDKGQASALIEKVIQRSREGLCTFRQARVLVKNGLNPDVTFQEASRAIDELSQKWRGRREARG